MRLPVEPKRGIPRHREMASWWKSCDVVEEGSCWLMRRAIDLARERTMCMKSSARPPRVLVTMGMKSIPAVGQVGSQLVLGANLQGRGGCRLLKGQVLEWGNDMNIQGCWPAVAPGGNEDIHWAVLGGSGPPKLGPGQLIGRQRTRCPRWSCDR